MGDALVSMLRNDPEKHVIVTSREERAVRGNITYVQGNAHNMEFLNSLLSRKYAAIIDFMSYGTGEFEKRVDRLLDATD